MLKPIKGYSPALSQRYFPDGRKRSKLETSPKVLDNKNTPRELPAGRKNGNQHIWKGDFHCLKQISAAPNNY